MMHYVHIVDDRGRSYDVIISISRKVKGHTKIICLQGWNRCLWKSDRNIFHICKRHKSRVYFKIARLLRFWTYKTIILSKYRAWDLHCVSVYVCVLTGAFDCVTIEVLQFTLQPSFFRPTDVAVVWLTNSLEAKENTCINIESQ